MAEDDYNLSLIDGYESYNESNSSDTEHYAEAIVQPKVQAMSPEEKPVSQEKLSPIRFINGKDGMATCEKCGTIGVKHAFYSKSKRFCSLSCSRSFATAQREGKPAGKGSGTFGQKTHSSSKKQSSGSKSSQSHHRTFPTSINSSKSDRIFDWGPYLMSSGTEAAPVSCFKHVAMSEGWDNITVGMKVEVPNYDTDLTNVFWIATVTRIAGYKALMRYEGFGNDSSKDFWINLCTRDVHPVGWCATIGKPLVPPESIQSKYADWKEFLVKRLTGARTLPNNFYNLVLDSLSDHKFKRGMHVEVVNKMCVSSMRVATIDEIVGGRLKLQYEDSNMDSEGWTDSERYLYTRKDESDEFWCHVKSPLIHPVGWSQHVGHKLTASAEYKSKCFTKLATQKYDSDDGTPQMFEKEKEPPPGAKFQVGMKLEAIDPLNLSAICVASVNKVLKDNFLMIGIDGSLAQNGSDWFCYHVTSPCIFPVSFCEVNNLELTPPRGYKTQFQWFEYLKQTNSVAAPVKLFDKEIPKHNFKLGMKLEAVDLMEPRLICVGTVARVVGRLLRIHFDGWEDEYDQWVDCESPDLYPVGWCEIVSYPIEGPRIKESPTVMLPSSVANRKRRGKAQVYKGPRKKRKPKLATRPQAQNGSKNNSSSNSGGGGGSSGGKSLLSSSCPPHVQMSSEAVAAALPPLLDNSNTDSSLEASDLKTRSVKSDEIGQEAESSLQSDTPPALSPHAPTPLSESLPASQDMGPKIEVIPASSARSSGILNGTNSAPTTSTGFLKIKSEPSTALLTAKDTNTNSKNVTITTPSTVAGLLTLASQSPDLALGGQLQTVITPSSTPITTTTAAAASHIPCIIMQDREKDTLSLTAKQQTIIPEMWTVNDVCQFLRINDCGSHCDIFSKKGIDGKKLMSLTREQIVNTTGMKFGPSLKIYELIQQLRHRVVEQSHLTQKQGAPS